MIVPLLSAVCVQRLAVSAWAIKAKRAGCVFPCPNVLACDKRRYHTYSYGIHSHLDSVVAASAQRAASPYSDPRALLLDGFSHPSASSVHPSIPPFVSFPPKYLESSTVSTGQPRPLHSNREIPCLPPPNKSPTPAAMAPDPENRPPSPASSPPPALTGQITKRTQSQFRTLPFRAARRRGRICHQPTPWNHNV